MNKVIISVALTGAITQKDEAPALPITTEEIVKDAIACAKAGASIAHIHVRDENGLGTMDTQRFREVFYSLKKALAEEKLDLLINFTTSGAIDATDEDRMRHVKELKPDLCSYDVGSLNWLHTSVFINSPPFLEALGKCAQENGVKPEIEIFDGGMVENSIYYLKKGILKESPFYQIVLGAAGGMSGTVENLVFLRSKLPEGARFSASGIGKAHLPILFAALAMGADGIRVGLEDNALMSKGVLATNVLLVERAVAVAKLAGREIATAEDARKILEL